MIATETELTEFHQFARQKLSAGSAASLQELLDEWTAAREYERSVKKDRRKHAAIRGRRVHAGEGSVR